MPDNLVPCSSCRACCKGDVILDTGAGDVLTAYVTRIDLNAMTGTRHVMLARKVNGDCVYLTEAGCGIYAKRPAVCREFDCRLLFAATKAKQRKALCETFPWFKAVFRAGRDRLATLRR